jgi:cell division transport system permease protein
VFDAVASLQWAAVGLIVLLAGTSAAAVWLAARSALGSNKETIEIIHLLGGTDGQIARIFQRSLGLDAVLGGVAGLAIGGAAILLLGRQFAALGADMVAGGELAPLDWGLLAAIPVIGVMLTMLTARVTVLTALRRML